jgi:hypothetical protein
LLDVALDGGPEVTEYGLDRLLHSNYHRFQAPLAGKRAPLDAASPADVAALQGMGTTLLSSRRLNWMLYAPNYWRRRRTHPSLPDAA